MHRLIFIAATVALAMACQSSTGPSLDANAAGDGVASTGNGSGNGSGGNRRCAGTLTGTFDNVTVPVGATCTLTNSTVRGNVKALENARLFMSNNQVRGNVEGDKASVVQVRSGTVGGNIQIKEGRSPNELGALVTDGTVVTGGDIQIEKMNTGQVRVSNARVEKGNIQITENITSGSLEIVGNHVAQNLQVFKNRGGGNKVVSGNTVGQDLQCKENTSPFTGGPNTAGDIEGQCS
jgi:hypothetical protein